MRVYVVMGRCFTIAPSYRLSVNVYFQRGTTSFLWCDPQGDAAVITAALIPSTVRFRPGGVRSSRRRLCQQESFVSVGSACGNVKVGKKNKKREKSTWDYGIKMVLLSGIKEGGGVLLVHLSLSGCESVQVAQ